MSLVTLTAQQPILITQEKNLGTITHITYSPDGRYIAYINEKDFLIKVWDVQSSKLIGTMVGHSASIKEVAFNASGDGLFSYDAKNKNYVWDLNTWNLKDSIVWPSEIKKVIINSDFSKAFAQNEREIFEYVRSSKVATPIVTKLKSPIVTFTVQAIRWCMLAKIWKNTGRIVIWVTQYWSKVSDFRSGVAMTMSPFVGFSADGNKFFVNTAVGIITYDFTVFNQMVKESDLDNSFRAPSVEITNLQDIPLVVSKNQITFNINASEKTVS